MQYILHITTIVTIKVTLKLQLNDVTAKLELFTPRPNQSKQIYSFLEELEKFQANLFTINPTLGIEFLHILQGRASGLYCLILLIKEASVSKFFYSFNSSKVSKWIWPFINSFNLRNNKIKLWVQIMINIFSFKPITKYPLRLSTKNFI